MSFLAFLLERHETDEDARQFHSALKAHLSDIGNFKTMLSNKTEKGYGVPVSKLNVPEKLKQKYSGFHTISLGNSASEKGKTQLGSVGTSREPKRRLFGLLPGKKGTHLAFNDMTHLTPGMISDPSMHKFAQKHTLEALDRGYPTFRHEFEHVHQRAVEKRNSNPVPWDHKGYLNHPDEVDADMAVLRHHLKSAYQSHPQNFAHINPIHPDVTNHMMKALHKTGRQTNDDDMKSSASRILNYNDENKKRVESVVQGHISNHINQMMDAHNDRKAKLAQRPDIRKHNGEMYHSPYSHNYHASGAIGFKTFLKSPNKHTPEGVYHEPDEAEHRVNRWHNEGFNPIKKYKDKEGTFEMHLQDREMKPSQIAARNAKRDSFYKANNLKVPTRSSKHPHLDDFENNPHHVAHFLNSMAKSFPRSAKLIDHNGPINYDTNLRDHGGVLHGIPSDEEHAASNAKIKELLKGK